MAVNDYSATKYTCCNGVLVLTELVTSNTQCIEFIYSYCSRGQLGHGSTGSCAEPTILDALNGLTMLSTATGGWHSAAISGTVTLQNMFSCA